MTSKEELGAAMHRIADALQYMRGPLGEVIFMGEKIPHVAWHLARAGVDVHPEKAIIKRQSIPNRPGQLAGMCNWVPIDTPDSPDRPDSELITAADGVAVDLDKLDDALPWHVKTHIEGSFR